MKKEVLKLNREVPEDVAAREENIGGVDAEIPDLEGLVEVKVRKGKVDRKQKRNGKDLVSPPARRMTRSKNKEMVACNDEQPVSRSEKIICILQLCVCVLFCYFFYSICRSMLKMLNVREEILVEV